MLFEYTLYMTEFQGKIKIKFCRRKYIPGIVLPAFMGVIIMLFPGKISGASDGLVYYGAVSNTPVLYTPDFNSVFGGLDGRTLKLDRSGLLRDLAFVALPGTVFYSRHTDSAQRVIRVSTEDYPYDAKPLYIDKRFVREIDFTGRKSRQMPVQDDVKGTLEASLGHSYMWGGNTPDGAPEMIIFYEYAGVQDESIKRVWNVKGFDCSGLLYFAAGGFTPRNTSSLVRFGKPVSIEGMSAAEVAAAARPLDLIVWAGHVVIVFDGAFVIESSLEHGVHK